MKHLHGLRTLAAVLQAVLVAVVVGSVRGQDPPPPPPSKPETPPASAPSVEKPAALAPPVLDGTSPLDLTGYEAALAGIASAYPDLLRVRSLGKSRGGRDLWLAVAADDAGGDAGRRPAAVVITDLAPLLVREGVREGAGEGNREAAQDSSALPHVAGPEAALFVLSSLLERARADPKVRERLLDCAVYFLPAPDPDAAFPVTEADAAPGPRRSRLDRNFPSGWEPYDADPKAPGPYPLCEPESHLLARFLLERVNVSMVVSLGACKLPEPGEGKPAGARAPEPAPIPGSLETYCREVLDATVFRSAPWNGPPRTSTVGTAPEGFFSAAAFAERILDDLPRLECGAPTVERLRPDVWLVDLPLSNAGSLPTVGKASRAGGASAVQLRASGSRVVACAVQTGAAGTYEAVRGARGAWPLGSLEGKAKVAVRLVVQGDEGTSLDAVFESARSGRAHVSVSLR